MKTNKERIIGIISLIALNIYQIPNNQNAMSKKTLSESDICAKYITPAVIEAGWYEALQIRREVSFTKGRIIVRGKLNTRGEQKRTDYILYYTGKQQDWDVFSFDQDMRKFS